MCFWPRKQVPWRVLRRFGRCNYPTRGIENFDWTALYKVPNLYSPKCFGMHRTPVSDWRCRTLNPVAVPPSEEESQLHSCNYVKPI